MEKVNYMALNRALNEHAERVNVAKNDLMEGYVKSNRKSVAGQKVILKNGDLGRVQGHTVGADGVINTVVKITPSGEIRVVEYDPVIVDTRSIFGE